MSRRGHGSVKVPNVKLRPAPLQQETRVNSRPESTRPEESEEFGLQQEMAGDVPPLERVVVCITGIKETRVLFVLVCYAPPLLTCPGPSERTPGHCSESWWQSAAGPHSGCHPSYR